MILIHANESPAVQAALALTSAAARHSHRSALIGSACDARRAGIAHAIPADKLSSKIPPSNISGLRELFSTHCASTEFIARISTSPKPEGPARRGRYEKG